MQRTEAMSAKILTVISVSQNREKVDGEKLQKKYSSYLTAKFLKDIVFVCPKPIYGLM